MMKRSKSQTIPKVEIRPQSGPQSAFLRSRADIAIYGGSAGGGKTFALLMEPLFHVSNPKFRAACFRRTIPMVKAPGSLWDVSAQLYAPLGATPFSVTTEWRFPSGASIKFSGMETEEDKFGWQGSQIDLLMFDEVCQFSEASFFYMLSRNRSMSGIRPYVRATCNPDPDSFVRRLISWWIDESTGYAIPERSGRLRWFVRASNEMLWADSREELVNQLGPDVLPKSLTFIPANVHDNKILLTQNPEYLANLKALTRCDEERLLRGNWNIRPASGDFFKREWFPILEAAPPGTTLRYWDRAATTPSDKNPDPDWTAGVKLTKTPKLEFIVEHVARFRAGPGDVKERIKNIAEQDGKHVIIGIEEDPGQAGKSEALDLAKHLAGFNVKLFRPTSDKATRAKPCAAQARIGNLKLVAGEWNSTLLSELEAFPDKKVHDDQLDALSGAFNVLAEAIRILVA